MRVVGLDLSMTSTGYAEWTGDLFSRGDLFSTTINTSRAPTPPKQQPTLKERVERLQTIETRIVENVANRCTEWPDLVVVEGPSQGSTGFMQHDISGNWHRVVGHLFRMGLTVVEVSPAAVKQYATGSGATRGPNKVTKPMVVKAVNGRYDLGPIALTPGQNDRADAIVLTAIGCRILGHPIDPHIPALNLKALTKIRLPEGITR